MPARRCAPFAQDSVAAALLASAGFFLLGYGAILLTPARQSHRHHLAGQRLRPVPDAALWRGTGAIFASCWRAYLSAICSATGWAPGRRCADGRLQPGQRAGDVAVPGADRQAARAALRQCRAAIIFGLKAGWCRRWWARVAAMLVTWLAAHADAFAAGRNWFFADVLGFCIVFPIGMTMSWRQIQKLRLPQRLPLAVVVVVPADRRDCVLVFPLRIYPLQFLVLPAALVVTVRFRVLGAGAALIIIADHRAGRAGAQMSLPIRWRASSICNCSWRCAASSACAPRGLSEPARPAPGHHRAAPPPRRARQPLQEPVAGPCQPRSAQPAVGDHRLFGMLESGSLSAAARAGIRRHHRP